MHVRLTLGLLQLFGWLAAAPTPEAAPPFDPYRGAQPLIVLRQTDPWMMVIGSDTPALVVYDDRTVIAAGWDDDGKRAAYRTKRLDRRAFDVLTGTVGTLCAGPPWKKFYDAGAGIFDLPSTQIFVRLERGAKTTDIYGPLAGNSQASAGWAQRRQDAAAAVPKEIRLLIEYLLAFNLSGSTVWHPDYMEVMLWPYEYAPDASTPWPPGWPGIGALATKACGADLYCVFLDGNLRDELERLAERRKPRGAILLGGKKWAMAYRAVFPGEPIWMAAFAGR